MGPSERGRTVQVPGPARRRWLSRPAPELAVRGGGTSRYRRQKRPRPGEIQVVPRLYDRPESRRTWGVFLWEDGLVEFEVQPDYTVEDYAAFWYGFLGKRRGKREVRRLSDRGMRLGGVVFLLAGGFLLWVYWFNPLEFQPVPLFLVWMGLAWLALGGVTLVQWCPGRSEPVQPRWAKRAWERWAAQDPGLRWSYRFTPAGMEMANRVSEHRFDYSQLQQLWEDGGHFYLTLDQRVWHILNKSQFTRGDPACFAAFLEERAGRPVEWVNGIPEAERRGVTE